MGNYVVYDHISPSGKHYIGQTCQRPEKRWGKNGKHYLGQNKYGEYKSMAEASRKLNISRKSIIAVCKGKKQSVKGYIFRYK